jgi:Tfp pilus assembly protein PilV
MSRVSSKKKSSAFALYEVVIGVLIFSIGVLALGRCVQNCLNASAITAEDERVRLILSNRMAEIQATPGFPDPSSETKIDTGYGPVKLVQKSVPAGLTENNLELSGITLVTLTVQWAREGIAQSRQLQFYVYRVGG